MKYYLGVDLGGTNIAAGVVSESFEIIAQVSRPTKMARSFEEIAADMAASAREAAENAGLGLDAFTSVGIGAPGPVDPDTGRLAFATNLGWKNAPLTEEFKKHVDKPVYLANDADCAAFGEYRAGDANKYPSVLFITLGTGVGGGMIMDGGRIFSGASGRGFEPGHTTLVLDGARCGCGGRGCIEAYASVTALIRETIEVMAVYRNSLMYEICGGEFSRVSGRTAFLAAKRGDEAGRLVVDSYARYLGAAIGSLVNSLRPHAVLVGGGISNEGEYLLGPVREIMRQTVYSADTIPAPMLMKATLGNAAGIIGAALLETQSL